MSYLFHLTECEDFDFDLSPPSLESEGFVHLSDASQVLGTANHWFKDKAWVKLLVLDPEQLSPELLKWEDSYNKGREYPHYFAPLPREAIVAVANLKRDGEGRYHWPDTLSGLRSPLLELPDKETGIIEPSRRFPEPKLPPLCLLNCFPDTLEAMDRKTLKDLGSAIGATEVGLVEIEGRQIAVCHPGVGGPVAAATVEELIALGCRKFVLCGGAGSLVGEQKLGQIVLVSGAYRDEGTSHHYLPSEPVVEVPQPWLQKLRRGLSTRKVDFTEGLTWTTDALYRETPSRVTRRREAGCLTVEMELASLLAVAQHRDVFLGALLYCGDDVSSEEWDFRDWTSAHTVQERLAQLASEILLET